MSMLNLEKRQRVLEEAFGNLQGMVAGLGTDLGDFIDEMSGQVHSLRGEVTHRVESLKNDIGGIETSMTMQVQGVGTQIGDLIRMLSCLLGSNKRASQDLLLMWTQFNHKYPVAGKCLGSWTSST